MMGWYNNGYGPWMMGGGGFIMMFGFVFIVGLVLFALFRRNDLNYCGGHHNSGPTVNNNALEILKERYAKGEIDSAEFNQKKQDLLK